MSIGVVKEALRGATCVPRYRDGTFEPVIVKKRQRRLTELDKVIEEMQAWTSRPLLLGYAAIFIDAI